LDESALIQLAVQHDEQAWDTLMRTYQQPVFRLAYLFTGDPDEAEDVTQETFIRAFHFIDRFDPARSFRPWILSIAANLSRNHLRGFKRYLATLQGVARRESIQAIRSFPDPASSEGAQEVWRSARKLSIEDQQVLYLRYFLELTEEETSAALGVPPGTVKSRLHRAMDRLRARLEQEYPETFRSVKHG
jgi:RNA polymerase sigma-70 factor (ECF subfamily)